MFNRDKKTLLILAVLALLLNPSILFAAEVGVASVGAEVLPINNTTQQINAQVATESKPANNLVSPSKPNIATTSATPQNESEVTPKSVPTVATSATPKNESGVVSESVSTVVMVDQAKPEQTAAQLPNLPAETTVEKQPATPENTTPQNATEDDFNFDLKMKTINAPVAPVAISTQPSVPLQKNEQQVLTDEDLPKAIQYKTNPIENLGNSILSKMDDDLFSQMSEIEKSTTLLTLELRREKIRNEIEAQKAIRQKAADDLERQKAEAKLKDLEREKAIEAKVLQEKQTLLDKQQLLEVLKQRKLLNAYMNHMLVSHQKWLKEKEDLYNKLALMEQEKKELTDLFKHKIEKLVDASAQNMQAAEAAKANFNRVVKSLKARNEQLRKRIEADAKIIKNAQSSLYLKSQSLEELQNKNAEIAASVAAEASEVSSEGTDLPDEEDVLEEDAVPTVKLSALFAILGITGRAETMSIDVIDANGQPISLKIGSSLPTGHVLKEIGSDYAMFTRDGIDEYLYVGRTIDGVIPTLGLVKEK